jgi:hypothetical protein
MVGIDPRRNVATGQVEGIVAAPPDCMNVNDVWPEMDLVEAVLKAGSNVVSTGGMGRVDHLTVLEIGDVSWHHSVDA